MSDQDLKPNSVSLCVSGSLPEEPERGDSRALIRENGDDKRCSKICREQ